MAYGNYGRGHICVISRRRHELTDGWVFCCLEGLARSILYDQAGAGHRELKRGQWVYEYESIEALYNTDAMSALLTTAIRP